jgi:hypothetical protein
MGSISLPPREYPPQSSFNFPPGEYPKFNKIPVNEPTKSSIPTSHIEPHLTETSFNIPTAVYPKISTALFPESVVVIRDIVTKKLKNLNTVLETRDFEQLRGLLGSSSYWRDHLGISATKYSTLVGPDEIIGFIQNSGDECTIANFEIESKKEPQASSVDPRGTIKCLQSYITFETASGRGRGLVKLLQDVESNDEWRIFAMFTTLYELKDFPPANEYTRRFHSKPDGVPEAMNWKEYRDEQREFQNEEPAVLIVGKIGVSKTWSWIY